MEFDEAVSYAEARMRKHVSGQDDDLAVHLLFSRNPPKENSGRREFETYLEALAYGIERNRKLPQAATEWLAKYLRGEIVLPDRKKGRPPRPYRLKLAIADCVEALVYKGLRATRNDVSEVKESACDAVALAMEKLQKYPQEFNDVKKVYNEVNRDAKEFALQEIEIDEPNPVDTKDHV